MKSAFQTKFATPCCLSLTIFLSAFSFVTASLAQEYQTPAEDQEEGFAVSSIPMIQPVTQEGGDIALLYRYHLDGQNKSSSSSLSAVGGFVTGNRSWGAGLGQKFFFKRDRWRVRLAATYADIRYNFYGIGTAAGMAGGRPGISVLMEQKGPGAMGELMYRFHRYWYGGAQYRFLDTTSSYRPNPQFDASVISPNQLDIRTASLGPRVTRDTRDDYNYPREGSLLELQIGLNGGGVGSQLTYQTYELSYNKYITINPSGVLAVRGASCFAGGTVPFFDECLLTASENLRGYRASRYRDRTMLASQAEYRWEAFKRVGFVAFAGAGEVGPRLGDFNFGNVLPGGGVGVRYRVTRESHVNIRFDYAWGDTSHQAYFFIGEAF